MNKGLEDLVDLMFDTDMEELMKEKSTLEYIHKLEQENKQLKERIDKAIEYIQKRFEINEYGEYYFTHTFSNSNMKELLEILGDKE